MVALPLLCSFFMKGGSAHSEQCRNNVGTCRIMSEHVATRRDFAHLIAHYPFARFNKKRKTSGRIGVIWWAGPLLPAERTPTRRPPAGQPFVSSPHSTFTTTTNNANRNSNATAASYPQISATKAVTITPSHRGLVYTLLPILLRFYAHRTSPSREFASAITGHHV